MAFQLQPSLDEATALVKSAIAKEDGMPGSPVEDDVWLLPIYREILADLETPVGAFLKLKRGEHSFLLESVEGGENLARYCREGCVGSWLPFLFECLVQTPRRERPFTEFARIANSRAARVLHKYVHGVCAALAVTTAWWSGGPVGLRTFIAEQVFLYWHRATENCST